MSEFKPDNQVVVAEIAEAKDRLRITINEWKGKPPKFDIRRFYCTAGSDVWLPTAKGFSTPLSLAMIHTLRAALDYAEEYLNAKCPEPVIPRVELPPPPPPVVPVIPMVTAPVASQSRRPGMPPGQQAPVAASNPVRRPPPIASQQGGSRPLLPVRVSAKPMDLVTRQVPPPPAPRAKNPPFIAPPVDDDDIDWAATDM
jgi:hypothetical protein